MRSRTSRPGKPPKHGDIRVGGPNAMKVEHMRAHLAAMTEHANEVRDYWRPPLPRHGIYDTPVALRNP